MSKFVAGDRVAWVHTLGSVYGQHATVRAEAVKALDQNALFGTVKSVDSATPTWFEVVFDTGETRTLTHEELVKIEEVEP